MRSSVLCYLGNLLSVCVGLNKVRDVGARKGQWSGGGSHVTRWGVVAHFPSLNDPILKGAIAFAHLLFKAFQYGADGRTLQDPSPAA